MARPLIPCLAFFPLVLVALAACFPTGAGADGGVGGGGGASYTFTNCPNDTANSPTCLQCVQEKCPTELASVNSACAAYLACACPAGANQQACATGSDDSGVVNENDPCTQAVDDLDNCSTTDCFLECQPDAG